MRDGLGRQVDYLRVSITDRCNERCAYCMPEHFSDWLPRNEILSYEEILRVCRVAAKLGVKRFRITGGEPLVRRDVEHFIAELAKLPSLPVVPGVVMTTNGTRLAQLARPLRRAGLGSLNISLDALDPRKYHEITRGRVEEALAGIDAAIDAGFDKVKLNTVLIRGMNEDELWPIIEYAAPRKIVVRFIELMPVTSLEMIGEERFLSTAAAREIISKHDELTPLPGAGADARHGSGPARYWRLNRLGLDVGFISAMSDEHFCESCNKMRLTADGFIRPCLGNHGEHDLKPALRPRPRNMDSDGVEEAVERVFRAALAEKPAEHIFRTTYTPLRIMTAIGG